MTVIQKNTHLNMLASFAIALLLTAMPLPDVLLWCRPQWVLLTLLYWVIRAPERYGIFLALLSGLFLDAVGGTPLGLQSIVFVLITYLVLKLHQVVAYASLWQQMVLVGIFTGIALVLQSILIALIGHSIPVLDNTISIVTSACVWPLFFFFSSVARTLTV